jgi:hypothetical protein
MVDDAHAYLGKAVNIGLTGTEVASFNGIVEKTVNGVSVVLVVFGGVDSTLSRDGMRPTGGVLEAKSLHLVPQFTKGRRRRGTGKSGAYYDDFVFSLVGRVDELGLKLVAFPFAFQRTGGNFGIEEDAHSGSCGDCLGRKKRGAELLDYPE